MQKIRFLYYLCSIIALLGLVSCNENKSESKGDASHLQPQLIGSEEQKTETDAEIEIENGDEEIILEEKEIGKCSIGEKEKGCDK